MRHEDWDIRLAAKIEQDRTTPFKWGTHDCATWAMDVRAIISDGQECDWRGKYDSENGAALYLKSLGLASLQDAGRSIMGDPLPNPLLAQRGDVVLGEQFGVCLGRHYAAPTDAGLQMYALRSARWAWRV